MKGLPRRDARVVEITNELPHNRLGGAGSAVESLISGFLALEFPVQWYLIDHHYRDDEIERIVENNPDVVVGSLAELAGIDAPIAHLHTHNHDPRILQVLQGRHIVLTVHSLLRLEAESNDIDLSTAIERQERLIAGASEVVLVSQAELFEYRRLGYLALNPRVSVIHNGVRASRARLERSASRSLGFCGRLVPRKRPEYVQWILKEAGFEDYRSLVAGRGFSRYARNLVDDPALAGRVRYLGWCAGERLEAFYAELAVLAIPSAYEPFGMVAVEAMARGVPIVCTRTGGLIEILGGDAVYAVDNSYDEFCRAMRRWLAMEADERLAMSERARGRHAAQFTDVAMAGNYRSLFLRRAAP